MKRTLWVTFSVMMMATACIAGCLQQKDTTKKPDEIPINNDPVTLKLFNQGAYIFPELQEKVKEVVSKKYPHITLKYVTGSTLEQLVTGSQVPDLLFTFWTQIPSFQDMDILEDLTPHLKKHNINLDRFSPNYLNDVKKASSKGELLALPYYANFFAIYYNKEIFDRFAVPYPKDGMTWDDMLALTRRVTREEGGAKYRGFDPSSLLWVSLQYGAFHIDPKTNKAMVNSAVWKTVFERMKSILTIPGNEAGTNISFIKDQNVAMLLNPNILDQMTKVSFNWDLVQYPILPENPNKYPAIAVHSMLITKTSKHKDQAMQVIDTFTSHEIQMWMSRQGKGSTLAAPDIKTAFGADVPLLKEKNLAGVLKSQPASMPVVHKRETGASSVTTQVFAEYLKGNLDVNSALRQAEEIINQKLQTEWLE